MRVPNYVLIVALTPLSLSVAQLSGGIGPVGVLSSSEAAWRTSALLSGSARFENALTNLEMSGEAYTGNGEFKFGSVRGHQQFFSPSFGGLRTITSLDYDNGLTGGSALSYRRGVNGAWLGTSTNTALSMGGWRQIGSQLTVAISSSLRRGTYGASAARTWNGTYRDSLPSDSGWVYIERNGIFGDSGSAGRKLSWLETEGKVGWSKGRFALDGVIGWRPAIDTAPGARWFRATTTIAVSKGVALSAGGGTMMYQVPFMRSTGRYATVAVRLAPAALVRPREAPEITPSASSFNIERAGEQYLVRVRLPQARIVELSGDFNGWQPVRLSREVDGTWTASLALKPGAYRMNLRVDGERWLPPPGTAAVDDEFNGKVGLVVVR